MVTRIVYLAEFEPNQTGTVKIVVDGEITDELVDIVQEWVGRQKRRNAKKKGPDCSEPPSGPHSADPGADAHDANLGQHETDDKSAGRAVVEQQEG